MEQANHILNRIDDSEHIMTVIHENKICKKTILIPKGKFKTFAMSDNIFKTIFQNFDVNPHVTTYHYWNNPQLTYY